MLPRTLARAICAGALAVVACAPATTAHAQSWAIEDTCRTAPADATLNIGPAAHAQSIGGTYSAGACKRFVVDINADGNVGYLYFGAQLAAADPSSWFAVPLVRGAPSPCEQYAQAITVYRRSASGSFTALGSARYEGQLRTEAGVTRCRLVATGASTPWYGALNGEHPGSGATWRVAFEATIGSAYQQVRVCAWPWTDPACD